MAKLSLVEILAFVAYAIGLIGLQLISGFNIPNMEYETHSWASWH
jgi:hypothetical protein